MANFKREQMTESKLDFKIFSCFDIQTFNLERSLLTKSMELFVPIGVMKLAFSEVTLEVTGSTDYWSFDTTRIFANIFHSQQFAVMKNWNLSE